jgi:hypothetical protein
MAISVNLIRLKARRIADLLPKREGLEVVLSVYNPGGKNLYQLNWKDEKNGGEWHIGYNCHIDGKTFYAFMEGIEAGIYELERSINGAKP